MTGAWTKIKTFYGFSKPYDFNVAIPALLNAVLFVLVVIKFIGALINNNKARIYGPVERNFLTFPSEMFYFYIYIFIGIILLTVFIRNTKLYWPLLIWFSVEFFLGAWGKGLAPFDSRTAFDNRFNYHALLQGVPTPNFKGRNQHLLIVHNSLGLRDFNNSFENLTRNGLIFVFGGSTTYDFAVSQGDTWIEKLNGLLGAPYKLFNFGVPGYTMSQHVIQTAFYGDINGVYPSCAIYYAGWNDIRNGYIAGLDRGYADWFVPSLSQSLRTRPSLNIMTISPLLKLTVRGIAYFVDTLRTVAPTEDESNEGRQNLKLKSIFQRNAATITAMNSARGVKTIFVGQMLNREALKNGHDSERGRNLVPFLKLRDQWKLQAELNDQLRRTPKKWGLPISTPISINSTPRILSTAAISLPAARRNSQPGLPRRFGVRARHLSGSTIGECEGKSPEAAMRETRVNLDDLKKAYGFKKPYDFNLAIPALITLGFFGLFVVMVAWDSSGAGNLRLIPSDFIFTSMCSQESSWRRWQSAGPDFIGHC